MRSKALSESANQNCLAGARSSARLACIDVMEWNLVTNWVTSLKAAAVGAAAGTAVGLLGFIFINSRQHPGMGAVLFLLVPVVAGFTVTLVARSGTGARWNGSEWNPSTDTFCRMSSSGRAARMMGE
jgi:hypothetical protein